MRVHCRWNQRLTENSNVRIALFRPFDLARKLIRSKTIRFVKEDDGGYTIVVVESNSVIGVIEEEEIPDGFLALCTDDSITFRSLEQYCLSEHAAIARPMLERVAEAFCSSMSQGLPMSSKEKDFIAEYARGNEKSNDFQAFGHYCWECIQP